MFKWEEGFSILPRDKSKRVFVMSDFQIIIFSTASIASTSYPHPSPIPWKTFLSHFFSCISCPSFLSIKFSGNKNEKLILSLPSPSLISKVSSVFPRNSLEQNIPHLFYSLVDQRISYLEKNASEVGEFVLLSVNDDNIIQGYQHQQNLTTNIASVFTEINLCLFQTGYH